MRQVACFFFLVVLVVLISSTSHVMAADFPRFMGDVVYSFTFMKPQADGKIYCSFNFSLEGWATGIKQAGLKKWGVRYSHSGSPSRKEVNITQFMLGDDISLFGKKAEVYFLTLGYEKRVHGGGYRPVVGQLVRFEIQAFHCGLELGWKGGDNYCYTFGYFQKMKSIF